MTINDEYEDTKKLAFTLKEDRPTLTETEAWEIATRIISNHIRQKEVTESIQLLVSKRLNIQSKCEHHYFKVGKEDQTYWECLYCAKRVDIIGQK